MFTREYIRSLCEKESTFNKGKKLAEYGDAEILDENAINSRGDFEILAAVRGNGRLEYDVRIVCDKDYRIVDYSCDCPEYISAPGMCRHCVAAALEYLEEYGRGQRRVRPQFVCSYAKTDGEVLEMIGAFARQNRLEEQKANGVIEIVPELYEECGYYYNSKEMHLSFKVGNEKKYVIKNLDDFAKAVVNEERVSYGKQLSFVHCKSAFTEKSWRYIEFLLSCISHYEDKCEKIGRRIPLTDDMLAEFLKMHLDQEVDYSSAVSRHDTIHVIDKNPDIKCILKKQGKTFCLVVPRVQGVRGADSLFVRMEDKIYHCSGEFQKAADIMLRLSSDEREREYMIAEKDMPAFCKTALPKLEQCGMIDRMELKLDMYKPKEAVISFYLDEENGRVTVDAKADYGNESHSLLESIDLTSQYRDSQRERRALDTAEAYFKEQDMEEHVLFFPSGDDDSMYQLLSTGIFQLEEQGSVYATDRIKLKKIVRSPKAQIGVSMNGGLLELKIDSDEFPREELAGILDSYKKRKKYYRMKNGDFLNLEENAVETVAELLSGLSLSKSGLRGDIIEVPKFRACFIDQVLHQGSGQLQIKRDSDYKAVIRDMKNIDDSDYAVPERLAGILRSYQKTGYRWLRTLSELGFGGILADDMGLGKTVQTITYLVAKKEEYRKNAHDMDETDKNRKSIIICPASLVYNWKREFETFAPDMRVRVISGTAAQREELVHSPEPSDIWITSYDTAKRDIDLYKEIIFDTEIIDEAQNIKNQGTMAAKAVKKIKAQTKFALTGTPIENRLSELWSIFDYLLPGLLGSYESFRKNYEIPIVHDQSELQMERLRKMVSPFILRRVKGDVLKELPEKLEQVIYSEMNHEQKKIYVSYAKQTLAMLKQKSVDEVRSTKLQILAELTRLRQICCDPALVYENYEDDACKVDTCMELVREAVEGNHKVLIFSQFTSIFPILQEKLDAEKIAYYTLTGVTPKETRLEMTEAFNKDDVPVFLISLKAGGTGLNLTAASIVIHFDPWWNLAAQNQATDRAHRIGQKNQVTVFKLIVKDTIEEKIIKMQEEKQKLASQILEAEGISAANLTKDDLLDILEI